MHKAAGLLFERGKIVIHLLDESERGLVIEKARIEIRARLPSAHRNDERFLYGVFLIEYFMAFSRQSVSAC